MKTPIFAKTRLASRLLALSLLGALIAAPSLSRAGLDEGLAAYDKADYAAAMKELAPLAEKGDAQAQYRLGRMFNLGQGMPPHKAEAAKWFHLAAEQGLPEAQVALGYLCLVGEGVSQNSELALEWTRKAADQGNVDAQYNLGVMHGDDYGVRKDPAESLKWMRRAAEQGHREALNSLGALYRRGAGGVKQDPVLAFMLFDLAAANGSASAASNRNDIEKGMNARQVEKGKDLAARWKRGTPLPKEAP